MEMATVNYAAVLVASVVSIIVSFIWYGPIFGKTWMKLMKVMPKDAAKGKKQMPANTLGMFVAMLVMNFILANLLDFAGALSVADALATGFMVWLGFIATVLFGNWIWSRGPSKLFAINVVHYLVILLVSSAIITMMSVRVIMIP
ncbi:MAG: DUF1761 domain-containing protein [Candidatus Aenigmarchaeota archaeon]|nr:DUF1761 domain-containing protein [Candidatus Aenigmarchaeota archaeon]